MAVIVAALGGMLGLIDCEPQPEQVIDREDVPANSVLVKP